MKILNIECWRKYSLRQLFIFSQRSIFSGILSFTVIVGLVHAAEAPWPEPFTLEFALAQASTGHPQRKIAEAELQQAQAELLQADAQYDLQSYLSARLRWIDPSEISLDQSNDDHRVSLFVNKRLYDFGRTNAQQAANSASVVAYENFYLNVLNQRRIAIMDAYFQALLSDYAYARDNEDLSIAYIRARKAAERNELGQTSDLDLLEFRSRYQASRVRRYTSDGLRRTTRARLANVLNRPSQLPSDLTIPDLPENDRDIPKSIESWLTLAENNNPLLIAMRSQVISAKQRVSMARANNNPLLRAEVEVSQSSRQAGAYGNWRAGIILNVPLLTGGKTQADIAGKRALLVRARAVFEQQRRQVRQSLLETWSELSVLKVKQDYAMAETDYREMYLDRSRALYEMEVKSDLGDSMTGTSAIRHDSLKIDFAIALAWARVDALMGVNVIEREKTIVDGG